MKYYFAPLESISSYPLRNAHARFFSSIDKYFSPFVSANEEGHYTGKIERDLSPQNNQTLTLIPQIMGREVDHMLKSFSYLQDLGYSEANLNLGCPSGTVVAKGKGAGMLRDLYFLEDFFENLFLKKEKDFAISVKCRIGISDAEAIPELFSLFNQFPFSEVIVHPRVQKQFYKGNVDLEGFQKVYEITKNPLVYNGDIENVETAHKIMKRFPGISGIMLGRGLLANPALAREIQGGNELKEKELKDYILAVEKAFSEEIQGDKNLLCKLKECWSYFAKNYPVSIKGIKELRKAKTMEEYRAAKFRIYSEGEFIPFKGEKEWI